MEEISPAPPPMEGSRRSADGLRRAQLPLLAWLLTGSGLLFAFLKIASEVTEGETSVFDDALLRSFRTAEGMPVGPRWLAEAVRDVTSLGSYVVLGFILIILVIYFLAVRKRFEAAFLAAAVVGGTLISNALKIGFNRPRPIVPNAPEVFSASFPSGHATMSAVVFLTIGAMLAWAEPNRRLGVFYVGTAIFLTLLIGVSRIYLGVHFPTDVVAGWCIGSAWAIGCVVVAQRLNKRRTSVRSGQATDAFESDNG